MATIKAPCGGIQLDGTKFKIVGDVITSVDSVATTFTTVIVCGGIKFDAAYFKSVKGVLTDKDSTETTVDEIIVGTCGGIAVDGAYFTITNGVMTFSASPELKTLTVASEAGTISGDTIITITEPITSGNHYVYKTALTVADPIYDADLSSWTEWNGVDEITAVDGDEIIVAEVNSLSDCRGFGSATVVANEVLGTLTLTSVMGATEGDTVISVAEALPVGRSYVYDISAIMSNPAFGDDLSGWTEWNGVDEITAQNDYQIGVATVIDGLCSAYGETYITSKDTVEVLTVTSVAGSVSGQTAITVDPAKTAGRTYVYKTDVTVAIPAYDASLAIWTPWNGTDEIVATTGNEIVIAEVFGSACRAAGKDIVASLA